MAGGDELALFAGKGAVVDGKGHLDGGFADPDEGNGLYLVRRADGIADVDAFQPGKADDVARRGALHGDAGKALDLIEIDEFAAPVDGRDIVVADGDLLVGAHPAPLDPADADAADVVVIVYGGHEQLHGPVFVYLHGRDMIEDGIEERGEVFALLVGIARRRARPARTEQDGAVELVVAGVEVEQEFEDLVLHFGDARVGAIHFIDDDDEFVVEFERLLHDEARLRHGAFRRVDEQQDAADHLEDAFDFAAEIGVPRGVDDVDLDAVIMDGCVFGEDGDAALALEGVGVHHALLHDLVFSEGAALFEHLIDERRFAVVDVRYDRHVP